MIEKNLIWQWLIIGLCLILVLFCTYQIYIVSNAVCELINTYEPILQQLKQIQDEVKNESGLSEALSKEISIYILSYQASYHASPLSFKLACIRQESSFNPFAIGPCGERGLTQIYYPTWVSCQAKGDFYNWHDTLRFGYQLMDECWIASHGNAKLAAMFYNGGFGILHRSETALAMATRHGRRVSRFYEQYQRVI